MDSRENQQSLDHPERNQTLSLISKLKKAFAFYLLPIFMLLLAISFTLTNTNCHKTQLLIHAFSSNANLFQITLGLLSPTQTAKPRNKQSLKPISKPPYCVLWMAPFLSGGGYSSESWSYILALHQHIKNQSFKLAIDHHGDMESAEFWEGLPEHTKNLAIELYNTGCTMDSKTLVICHSEPGAWYPPLFETSPCPPGAYQNFKAVIGRTMFETDRVNSEHVKRCNKMDYVWVPTEFHVSTFIESGVDPSKVVKIVQPVDVKFFDPLEYKPLNLRSVESLVLGGPTWKLKSKFVFLSVFKWEYRKGWDVLLKAYLEEFSGVDGVALYLLTNPYHSDSDFGNKIVEFVENSGLEKPITGWAPVYVIDSHIAQSDLPSLYKAADAFVLPTRGEGWGRPIVEAMAMSLPVIATNWSGPTEYMTEENSYPLPPERIIEVMEGPFRGHLWAEPSAGRLRVLMRCVKNNFQEAKARGKKAREDMVRKFSPDIVASILADHIQTILEKYDK